MALSGALIAYSKVYSSLTSVSQENEQEFKGTLTLTEELVEDLRILVENSICDSSIDLVKDGKELASIAIESIEAKHFNFDCKIGLASQWEKAGYFIGPNWDTLLKSATRILRPVRQAYFTDNKELTSSQSAHFKNYLKLSKVCNLIDQVALPANEQKNRTVIFERDINIAYTLKYNDLEHDFCVEAIEKLLVEDIHHEAKVALVREALVKFLKDKGANQRFGYLISHFNAFSAELMLSYQSYVEQYTFDKVRKEYQEKQTEYIQKINDIYSDIGAKVLAIPAGLWLAVFKVEEAQIGSFNFIKNIIILMLCILCMFYISFHFFAQFSVLKSVILEYQSLFERLAKEHDAESKDILISKSLIDKNASWAWFKLALSTFATVIVFTMVLILSWYSITN